MRRALLVFLFLIPVTAEAMPRRLARYVTGEAGRVTYTLQSTIAADSCENAAGMLDVQDAIGMAVDGDTVTVPAGSCTWTTQVTFSNLNLTLVGAGIDQTSIMGNTGAAVELIKATTCSASDFVDISGFTFQPFTAPSGYNLINIACTNVAGYPPVAFRFHHNKVIGDPGNGTTNLVNGRRFLIANVYGLVDNNQFLTNTSIGLGGVSMQRDSPISTGNNYHHSFVFGDQNALYMENNVFRSTVANQHNGATDNYAGTRIVFRFNTVYNNNIGWHGFDSQNRGTATFEVYGNTFIAESGVGSMMAIHARSGTGLIWANTVTNNPGAATGYTHFFRPIYYGGLSSAEAVAAGGLWYAQRPAIFYPTGTWGTIPYPGTTSITDSAGNFSDGDHPVDGNQFGPGNMDADYSRTVTDLVTTAGSKTITSADANFVAGDVTGYKVVSATNVTAGRVLSCTTTASDTTVTCASGNFTAGDVGRQVSANDRATISGVKTIASVTDSTTIELSTAATASGTKVLIFANPYIVSITNESTAVLNVPATANGTGGTLTIGYTNQGYPLLDQPGRGYFATANAGNWPNVTTGYTDANYEALMPVYLAGNLLAAVNPATVVYFASTAGYMKANRDWYDPTGGIQTDSSTPFNGTVGTGIGTLANRPATCTTGVGYLAVNQGSWNTSGQTWTYPSGGSSYSNGIWYKCTATNTWSTYATPLDFPHPLAADEGPELDLEGIDPNFGNRNTTIEDIELSGIGFEGGDMGMSTEVEVSGTGVTPACDVDSDVLITCDFAIAVGATLGDRSVTVTTDEGSSNAVTFTVIAASAPTLTSIDPNQCYRGSACGVTLTGTAFDGGSGTITEACTGIAFSSIVVVGATSITATVTIAADAPLVACEVAVTTSNGVSNTVNFQPLSIERGSKGRLTLRGGR